MANISKIIGMIITCLWGVAQAQTIMIYGDSLSAAYGLRTNEGWPALLAQDLAGQHSIINASMSGETTAGGLQRLSKALEQHKPQIVILGLGGNDALRGLPLAQSRDHLDRMIQTILQHRAKVILLGMDIPPNYGARYRAEFFGMYPKLANQNRITLVADWLKPLGPGRQWFQEDAIHPVAAAQPLLLKPIQAKLYPMLKHHRNT